MQLLPDQTAFLRRNEIVIGRGLIKIFYDGNILRLLKRLQISL